MLSRSLISRAILLRGLKNTAETLKQAKRNAGHGSWAYRTPPKPAAKKVVMLAEGLGAIAWCWIFWHIFTEYEHVTGEWPVIKPHTWTDEELGIPPDSYGPLKK